MKRIMIIGNNGSGKSTFASQLGKKLRREVVHLDGLFHLPNGKRMENKEWDKIQAELVKKKEWIIDGTYLRTLDTRLKEADTIIFLDSPKWICLYRIIKRRIIYRKEIRPDLPKYMKERVSFRLLQKLFTFPRDTILSKLEGYQNIKKIITLHNADEIKTFVTKIS